MKKRLSKLLCSFLLVCVVLVSRGQSATSLNNSNLVGGNIVKSSEVNSAFLFSKDYLLADIIVGNGKTIMGNKVRLNLQDNKLYYMIGADEEMEVSMPVKQITFVVQEGNTNVITFATGFPSIGKLTQDNFYQVLASGKVSLLLDTKFLQSTRVQVPVGPVTETTKLENYYGTNGSIIVKITKPEDLTELMADKAKEVMEFIRLQKIKVRKQSDLLKVFNFYNGTVQ
ncbi:MAG: hypothetical protein ABI581_13185 [Sediminibacterium sp.]